MVELPFAGQQPFPKDPLRLGQRPALDEVAVVGGEDALDQIRVVDEVPVLVLEQTEPNELAELSEREEERERVAPEDEEALPGVALARRRGLWNRARHRSKAA